MRLTNDPSFFELTWEDTHIGVPSIRKIEALQKWIGTILALLTAAILMRSSYFVCSLFNPALKIAIAIPSLGLSLPSPAATMIVEDTSRRIQLLVLSLLIVFLLLRTETFSASMSACPALSIAWNWFQYHPRPLLWQVHEDAGAAMIGAFTSCFVLSTHLILLMALQKEGTLGRTDGLRTLIFIGTACNVGVVGVCLWMGVETELAIKRRSERVGRAYRILKAQNCRIIATKNTLCLVLQHLFSI